MKIFFSIAITTLKMLLRNKQSLFFTLFLPLFLMLVIGYVTRSNDTTIRVGVIYDQSNSAAQMIVDAMGQADSLDISTGTKDEEQKQMHDNKRDILVEIPADFSLQPQGAGQTTTITLYTNQANPAQSSLGTMVVQQFFRQFEEQATNPPHLFAFTTENISGQSGRYIDFLVPGIISMTIMQLGIFGTAFAIVDAKQKGVLKRVIATPVRPWQYVIGNMVARLFLSLCQAAILIIVARLVFDVHFQHWGWLAGLIILGNVVFLSLGLFISGVAKTVETVPILGNLIVFPMLLLGGVFFPTTNLPSWLKIFVTKLPIALLADLMRNTVTYSQTLKEVYQPLLWLVGWAVIALVLANKFFRLQERD